MKKLFILMIVLFTINGSTQEKHEGVYIDRELISYVSDYVEEAKKRGIDVIPIIRKMHSIEFRNLVYPTLGYALKNQTYIGISPYLKLNKILLRVTVYHELTHALFLKEHCECPKEIMNDTVQEDYEKYNDYSYMTERLNYLFDSLD